MFCCTNIASKAVRLTKSSWEFTDLRSLDLKGFIASKCSQVFAIIHKIFC